MVKMITKKEVKEMMSSARDEHPFGWRLWVVGAYIDNQDRVEMYINYHSQGMDINIYNGTYKANTDLTDLADKIEWNLKSSTDIAYDRIKEMVEEYNKNLEE